MQKIVVLISFLWLFCKHPIQSFMTDETNAQKRLEKGEKVKEKDKKERKKPKEKKMSLVYLLVPLS